MVTDFRNESRCASCKSCESLVRLQEIQLVDGACQLQDQGAQKLFSTDCPTAGLSHGKGVIGRERRGIRHCDGAGVDLIPCISGLFEVKRMLYEKQMTHVFIDNVSHVCCECMPFISRLS